MNSIILAAGMGTRLKNFTNDKPKALVRVADKTLIEYVIGMATRTSPDKIIIVTGSGHAQVKDFVEHKYHDGKIMIVENANYKKGNLYSLQEALALVKGSFFLFNVDHVFSKQFMLATLDLSRNAEFFTVFCDNLKAIELDQMKVLEKNGQMIAISKKLTDYNTGYSGLDYCPETALHIFKSAVSRAGQSAGDNAVKEDAINHLVMADQQVRAVDISGFNWFEVDTPEDLALAEKMIYQTADNWL